MKGMFAITGTVFFSIFLVSLIVYSTDPMARNIAMLAAFLAGLSQFIAQDERQFAAYASIAIAYLSMLLGLIALFGFVQTT